MTAAPTRRPPRGTGRTRTPALAVPLVLVSLVSACGGDDAGSAATTTTTTAPPATSSPGAAPSGAAPAAKVLTGTVGMDDAFTITVVDSAGAPVNNLPAGSYRIDVQDLSKIHNFHLTGPGVDEETAVPAVTDTTWTVTLQAGAYTYTCDPHPDMRGTFTVT